MPVCNSEVSDLLLLCKDRAYVSLGKDKEYKTTTSEKIRNLEVQSCYIRDNLLVFQGNLKLGCKGPRRILTIN